MAGFLDQRYVELAHDLGTATVGAEEVLRADLVGVVGEGVGYEAEDCAGGFSDEGDDRGREANGPAISGGASSQDRLEVGLREIDVLAGAGGVVVASAFGIVPPAVDASVFVASQAVAPASVFHMFAWCSLSAACLLEVDVPQAFEGGGIGDVRSWCLGRCWCGGDEDTSNAVGWVG